MLILSFLLMSQALVVLTRHKRSCVIALQADLIYHTSQAFKLFMQLGEVQRKQHQESDSLCTRMCEVVEGISPKDRSLSFLKVLSV